MAAARLPRCPPRAVPRLTRRTATPSGGVSPYTYSWTGPGGFTSTSQTIGASTAGTYTVTVTDSGSTHCTASGSGTVTVNAGPTVAVNSPQVCAGGSATI